MGWGETGFSTLCAAHAKESLFLSIAKFAEQEEPYLNNIFGKWQVVEGKEIIFGIILKSYQKY